MAARKRRTAVRVRRPAAVPAAAVPAAAAPAGVAPAGLHPEDADLGADPALEVLEADEVDGGEGDAAEELPWRDNPGAVARPVPPVQLGWAPHLGALTTPSLPPSDALGPLADAVRRRPRKAWAGAAGAVVLVVAVVVGAVLLRAEPGVRRLDVAVQVGPQRHDVRVPLPVTVGSALRAADVAPRPGRLLSVVTGTVLDPAAVPAFVTLDGLAAGLDAPVRDGQTIGVSNPPDLTEAVVEKVVETPAPLPPQVENGLWHPGRPGLVRLQVGERSGEEASRTVGTAAAPPAPVTGKLVAITFDDGPHPTFTPAALRVLREKDVKALFCVVGQEVRRHRGIVKAEVDEGHALCNHTMSHDRDLPSKPTEVQDRDIAGLDRLLAEQGHERPLFYRPPGGHLSQGVVDVARKHGHRVLKWTADPNDYAKPGVQQIVDRVMAQLRPGGVILLHDGGGDRGQTLAALPAIIDRVREAGYTFVRPDQVPPV